MANEINIEEINRNLQESYIHYDPSRVDYSINNLELEMLENVGSSIWKDVFLATIGIAIPSLVNAYCEYSKLVNKELFTKEIFINTSIGGICLIMSIISLIIWQKNKTSFKTLISQIKNKPKYRLPGQS